MNARPGTGAPIVELPECGERRMFPRVVHTTLANGLRVVLAEDHTVPAVFLSWTSLAGSEFDPPGLEGIASLTPSVLREGTARRTASQIGTELDDLGATLSSGTERDTAFVNVALLSIDLATGLDLLTDIACRAAFPDAAVARVRRRRLAEIEHHRGDPRTIADEAFDRALFGPDVEGRVPLGTAASVQRIDTGAMTAFHDRHYRAAGSCVSVAGSFDGERAMDLLRSLDLPEARGGVPAAQTLRSNGAADVPGGITCVDVPRAPQTEIRIGHASLARDDEHRPQLELLNIILGAGPNSRLARRLRQQLGLAYRIRSRVAARGMRSTFVVETSVASDAAAEALEGIRGEIERLRDDRATEGEVEQAKRRLVGAELRSMHDLIGMGLTLGPAALRHDPDYLERRAHAIASAGPEGLREVARRAFHPERLVAVLAGPAAALHHQFSSERARAWRPLTLESTS